MEKVFNKLPFLDGLIDPKPNKLYDARYKDSNEDLKYALVITYHPRIINRIKQIQSKIDKFPFKYPAFKTFDEYLIFKRAVMEVVGNEVLEMIDQLMEDLRLTKNWRDSLIIKTCTNILPMPYSSNKFSFHKPNSNLVNSKIEAELNTPKTLRDLVKINTATDWDNIFRLEDANYAYIAIKEKIKSKQELINYINEIFDKEIKPAIAELPVYKHEKADIDRFILAVWLYHFTNIAKDKPKGLSKVISDLEANGHSFRGFDVTPSGISKLIDEAKTKLSEIYPL